MNYLNMVSLLRMPLRLRISSLRFSLPSTLGEVPVSSVILCEIVVTRQWIKQYELNNELGNFTDSSYLNEMCTPADEIAQTIQLPRTCHPLPPSSETQHAAANSSARPDGRCEARRTVNAWAVLADPERWNVRQMFWITMQQEIY